VATELFLPEPLEVRTVNTSSQCQGGRSPARPGLSSTGGLVIRFAEPCDEPALRRLGERLAETQTAWWPLARIPLPGAPGPNDSFPVRRRRLIIEEDGEIRAIQNFFEHEIYVEGKPYPFVWPNAPLSEALTQPRYSALGLGLLRHSLSLQPLHLSFGSFANRRLTQMYLALGWRDANVPLFVMPLNVRRLCTSLPRLRMKRGIGLLATLAAHCGIADVGTLILSARRALTGPDSVEAVEEDHFGSWADETWSGALSDYRVVTRRDAATLNRLYRPGDRRVKRLWVRRRGRTLGWVLLALRDFRDDPTFGSARIALLADALAGPADATEVMGAGLREAAREGADLCMGYWAHRDWREAARRIGFWQFRSGAMLYVSKQARPLVLPDEQSIESFHLTRGDCDGPQSYMMRNEFDGTPWGS
jgi:hypothetical protein